MLSESEVILMALIEKITMIIDSKDILDTDELKSDVCIIGSGPAGII